MLNLLIEKKFSQNCSLRETPQHHAQSLQPRQEFGKGQPNMGRLKYSCKKRCFSIEKKRLNQREVLKEEHQIRKIFRDFSECQWDRDTSNHHAQSKNYSNNASGLYSRFNQSNMSKSHLIEFASLSDTLQALILKLF
jgi:hypothetical protein